MSAHRPSEIPPERARPVSPVLPASGVAYHVTAPARRSGGGAGAGSAARSRASRWMDLGLPRARQAVALELTLTTVLTAAGGATLCGLLGGGQLLLRAHMLAAAAGWGGGIMGLGLFLSALWGFGRTVAAVQVLRQVAPESLGEPAAAALRRAVRETQRLPYYVAGGFFGAGVGGGIAAVSRLGGLRSEDRVVAALLWGFCCGIAALAVVLRLRSFIAPVAQALQARAPDSVRPLLSVRSKLLCGFGWLLLCVTALSLLKHLLLGQLEGRDGQVVAPGLRGLLFLLPVQVAAAGGIVALAVVGLAWPVRDLLRRASAVVGETRGALQRPIVLGVSATAEVVELQRLFDQLRRLLLSRLRSSTEQNLQLEAEVARRTGELSRRNAELSDALFRLQSAREELLRAEKLAKVGRIAAGISSEIDAPVARMTSHCGELTAAVQELMASLPAADAAAPTPQNALLLERALHSLTALTDGATRVRDIVRAMRVYIRPGATAAASWAVADVVADVRQLFDEPAG